MEVENLNWYIEEQEPVYLDHNATTPLHPEVRRTIIDSLSLWANPSSNNPKAKLAHDAIEKARQQVADLFHVTPKEIFFTSGGTETNSWVLDSAIEEYRQQCRENRGLPHIITSVIDHPAIVKPLKSWHEQRKIDVTFCNIDKATGCVNVSEVEAAIRNETCLVTIMLANNETGVIQPIAEISDVVRKASNQIGRKIIMHSDTTQAIGKVNIDLNELKIDLATVAGHKFYGPRIGALVLRSLLTVPIHPFIYGCEQERGFRAGTENTPMIAGLGKACELAFAHLAHNENHLQEIRDYFEKRIKEELEGNVSINFEHSPRLPNTSSVAFPKYADTSADLLSKCHSFYASTAAAGHSKKRKASAILISSGVSEEVALRTIRISFGTGNTKEEVDRVVKELKAMCFLSQFGTSLIGAFSKGPVPGF
ncbi:unnamed protein product, partial [Mesorhabditis belari]|uniref:Selenocysteine lyase n=1 Tax=Mesorhabditis belari TaxID=2138241 RepID=A0AAF3EXW1_9BILA